ncbi:transcriptional regulator [Streptomyces sp. AC1-42W]|uniref:transcriptional regulator n=1 Tax=Streptomyces sp. AC1-42W TaxID=2218666 RepID=UPI001F53EAE9|nr:transcriptional regulator [Streptomyces sp. AC1-42W]
MNRSPLITDDRDSANGGEERRRARRATVAISANSGELLSLAPCRPLSFYAGRIQHPEASMARPPTGRRPNALLAHWFTRTGMSRVGLARAVTDRAVALGHRGIGTDESRVRRWLNGETPRPPVPQLITDVINARLGLRLTCADLGFPGPRDAEGARRHPDFPWKAPSTIDALADITRSEFMLPTTRTGSDAQGVHAGDDLLAPLQHWVSATPTGDRTEVGARRSGHIGAAQVEGIRAATATFRDLDNRHGGALSRKAVLGQLDDAVAMLNSCSYTTATGQALFSAVADLGSVAGWMTFDAGRHAAAQRLFVTALHAASEGGDKALGAHILQCMARQMSHLERYEDALDLIALARFGARRRMSPATVSMLAALEARFHAILGNVDESERAADHAQEAFTRVTPGAEPAHMTFFDTAELSATIGVAHQIAAKHSTAAHRARRAEKSVSLISHALDNRPEHRVRSKAFDHLGLARTYLVAEELDGALLETERALDLFGVIESRRVADRLVELHDEAKPFAGGRSGGRLRELIAAATVV